MSSIMRARNGLTGRSEVSEVIGLSPELKVAGPSMLGIRCPDRHALPRITSPKTRRPRRALPPARAGSFIRRNRTYTKPLFRRSAQGRSARGVSAAHGLDPPPRCDPGRVLHTHRSGAIASRDAQTYLLVSAAARMSV